jgi:hypothetical protein
VRYAKDRVGEAHQLMKDDTQLAIALLAGVGA